MSVETTNRSLQLLFRISDETGNEMAIENKAIALASKIEHVFGVDGSNIVTGVGRWKGKNEFGATIETVVKDYSYDAFVESQDWFLRDRLRQIRDYAVNSLQLTVFVTLSPVVAVELY
jgi:hypothetical protein